MGMKTGEETSKIIFAVVFFSMAELHHYDVTISLRLANEFLIWFKISKSFTSSFPIRSTFMETFISTMPDSANGSRLSNQ